MCEQKSSLEDSLSDQGQKNTLETESTEETAVVCERCFSLRHHGFFGILLAALYLSLLFCQESKEYRGGGDGSSVQCGENSEAQDCKDERKESGHRLRCRSLRFRQFFACGRAQVSSTIISSSFTLSTIPADPYSQLLPSFQIFCILFWSGTRWISCRRESQERGLRLMLKGVEVTGQ